MEHSNENRQYTLRFVCMLMLILMHLDIYGQGMVSFLYHSNYPNPVQLVNNQAEDAVEYTQPEWEDSNYQRSASRLTHVGKPYFYLRTILAYLPESLFQATHIYPEQPTLWHIRTHVCLLYCLLII